MSLLALPVPTSIASLIHAMERLHRPKGPYVTPHAPTDERFVNFTSSGVLQEGVPLDSLYLTPEAAYKAYWCHFLQMSHQSPDTRLYWRSKPDLSHTIMHIEVVTTVYKINSRFILSNKPVISRQFEEECLGTYKAPTGKAQIQSSEYGREALQGVAA